MHCQISSILISSIASAILKIERTKYSARLAKGVSQFASQAAIAQVNIHQKGS
jgi:hypothetical protein